MKKPLSKEASRREEAFWKGLKRLVKENPARLCQK
jgi:hypothetical protein